MVKALFDTNILIDSLGRVDAARAEIALHDQPAISLVTWMEVLIGAEASTEGPIRAFLASFRTISMDAEIAETAIRLRRTRRLKLPDAIIWAPAITSGRLLVTRNPRDFPADDPGVREPYCL
jgi:predicted nucleic acid-binding protein